MTDNLANPQSRAALGKSVQAHLGEHLRSLYGELVVANLPRDLAKLTKRLERALQAREQPLDQEFIRELLRYVPNLRAYAISLTRDPTRAEDLVQEALLKACDHHSSFETGTSMQAWLTVILRNGFHSQYRKTSREVEDGEGAHAATLISLPDQIPRLELQDLSSALDRLPNEQREAILLVGVEGVSYEDAAQALGVKIGTIKSRVNRARHRLAEHLGFDAGDIQGTRLQHE